MDSWLVFSWRASVVHSYFSTVMVPSSWKVSRISYLRLFTSSMKLRLNLNVSSGPKVVSANFWTWPTI